MKTISLLSTSEVFYYKRDKMQHFDFHPAAAGQVSNPMLASGIKIITFHDFKNHHSLKFSLGILFLGFEFEL
jgi:hypothetical protein